MSRNHPISIDRLQGSLISSLAFLILSMASTSDVQAQKAVTEEAKINRNLEAWAEVYRYLLDHHYASPDADTLLNAAVAGMLSRLDPYSRWSPPLGTGRVAGSPGSAGSLVEGERIAGDSLVYIRLAHFRQNSGFALRSILGGFEHTGGAIAGVILDLRGNPGGVLEEAVEVASAFLPRGSVVLRSIGARAADTTTYFTRQDPVEPDVPLAVLVDYGSASSAEIVAAALADHGRAILYGEPTLGKGLIQQPTDLSYGASLRVSTASIERPSGNLISEELPVVPSHAAEGGIALREIERRRLFDSIGHLIDSTPSEALDDTLFSRWIDEIRRDTTSAIGGILRAAEPPVLNRNGERLLRQQIATATIDVLRREFDSDRRQIERRLIDLSRNGIEGMRSVHVLMRDPLIAAAARGLLQQAGRGKND